MCVSLNLLFVFWNRLTQKPNSIEGAFHRLVTDGEISGIQAILRSEVSILRSEVSTLRLKVSTVTNRGVHLRECLKIQLLVRSFCVLKVVLILVHL